MLRRTLFNGNYENRIKSLETLVGTLKSRLEEKNQENKTLRNEINKYHFLAENTNDVTYALDSEGRFIYISESVTELGGYTARKIIGNRFTDFIHDQNKDLILKAFLKRKFVKEKPLEFKVLNKEGKDLWVRSKSRTTIDAHGKEIITGALVDITDRKKAEELLENFFKISMDLFCIIEFSGKFKFINPAFKTCLGFTEEEVYQSRFMDFVHADDRKTTGLALKNLIDGKPMIKFRIRWLTSSGDFKWFSWTTVPEPESGVAYAVARDITTDINAGVERKMLASQLQKAQKMEAVGTLAGGIAHDFNNLLMGIQGNLSLLLIAEDIGEKHLVKIRNMEKYVQSGAELTGQLLGIARGGKYELKAVNINGVLKKSSDMFGRTKKEIQIHLELCDDLWTVFADCGQIEQVLLNMYVNAWQSMGEGGDLTITSENIYPSVFHKSHKSTKNFKKIDDQKYILITIADTGAGMDPGIMDRIFDPFFTTKKMGKGTGLGLASAWGIIKSHGGTIDVQSEPGRGAKFYIYLPAVDTEAENENRQNRSCAPGCETILLVDDEDMILDATGDMLKMLGYTVFTAVSGEKAIEIFKNRCNDIHLIILDMVLPEMNGAEIYARLKEIKKDVKVLLSSGYSLESQASDLMEKGCDGFIQKPYNIDKISNKIRELMASRTVSPQMK